MSPAVALEKPRRWPYALVWILPLAVLALAISYFRFYRELHGPEVVIEVTDANGLVAGQARISYRGAEVGKVTAIDLTPDGEHALVHARLRRDAASFASRGAVYWIERSEILSGLGASSISNLLPATLRAIPGKGEEDVREFRGLEHPPREPARAFVLTTPWRAHVQEGSSVAYKGVKVGVVREARLAADASHVELHVLIWDRYAGLVHTNTRFWVDPGIELSGGILSGLHFSLDSLSSMFSGRILFATPEGEPAPEAKAGARFAIEEKYKADWKKWSPRLRAAD